LLTWQFVLIAGRAC